jgi:SAM-dependent methyltransferase
VVRPPFPDGAFDVVVMASSVQYFDDLGGLLVALKSSLRPGGEIHVVDSPIYAEEEVPSARRRSAAYYGDLGMPAMAGRYHHHTWTALAGFEFDVLYDPFSTLSRVRRRLGSVDSPFPWLRVRFPA